MDISYFDFPSICLKSIIFWPIGTKPISTDTISTDTIRSKPITSKPFSIPPVGLCAVQNRRCTDFEALKFWIVWRDTKHTLLHEGWVAYGYKCQIFLCSHNCLVEKQMSLISSFFSLDTRIFVHWCKEETFDQIKLNVDMKKKEASPSIKSFSLFSGKDQTEKEEQRKKIFCDVWICHAYSKGLD